MSGGSQARNSVGALYIRDCSSLERGIATWRKSLIERVLQKLARILHQSG